MERDTERQRRDDRERQEKRPATEEEGESGRGRQREEGEGDQPRRVVAQVSDLVRVPLIAEDQGREEGQRGEHRGGAQAAGGQQDRAGRG